jgi:hypothetical protein
VKRSRRPVILSLLLAGAVLAVGIGAGRALTASIPAWGTTSAGIGAVGVSAYTVSSIAYNRNSVSPQNVDSVTFTISPTNATTIKITFAGNTYSCSGTSSVTCATTSPQALASTASTGNLVVVAVQ